jgi:hypothetical protein
MTPKLAARARTSLGSRSTEPIVAVSRLSATAPRGSRATEMVETTSASAIANAAPKTVVASGNRALPPRAAGPSSGRAKGARQRVVSVRPIGRRLPPTDSDARDGRRSRSAS